MNVLDIFYNEIIKEAAKGIIQTDYSFNIIFSTKIEGEEIYTASTKNDNVLIPTLNISDKYEFNYLLTKYTDLAIDFYPRDYFSYYGTDPLKKEREKIKTILSLLFANATYEDFNDPCTFLKRRIDYIENSKENKVDLGYSDTLNADVSCYIEKDTIFNETPYRFCMTAEDDVDDYYYFPCLKFGISDNKAYVYAIQRDDENENSRKVSRSLYKVGEGFDPKTDNFDVFDEGNLNDVTPSFLVILDAFVAYLNTIGVDEIVVPSFLVERWNAKEISYERRLNANAIDEEKLKKLEEQHIKIQKNLTEKLLRTFLRLDHHYPGVEISSLPMENDSSLRIKVNNLEGCNNKLLDEVKDMTINSFENKKIR